MSFSTSVHLFHSWLLAIYPRCCTIVSQKAPGSYTNVTPPLQICPSYTGFSSASELRFVESINPITAWNLMRIQHTFHKNIIELINKKPAWVYANGRKQTRNYEEKNFLRVRRLTLVVEVWDTESAISRVNNKKAKANMMHRCEQIMMPRGGKQKGKRINHCPPPHAGVLFNEQGVWSGTLIAYVGSK